MPRPGPVRPLLNLRVATEDQQRLRERAAKETEGNVSELGRRMITFALAWMPEGWNDVADTWSDGTMIPLENGTPWAAPDSDPLQDLRNAHQRAVEQQGRGIAPKEICTRDCINWCWYPNACRLVSAVVDLIPRSGCPQPGSPATR